MRLRPSPIATNTIQPKLGLKINGAIKRQTAIRVDINPLGLEIRGSINNTNIPRLNKVIRNEEILLIRGDFNIVRADDALVLIGVVEALDGGEIGNVEGGYVVPECEGEVSVFAVGGNVRVDGEVVARFGPEVEE